MSALNNFRNGGPLIDFGKNSASDRPTLTTGNLTGPQFDQKGNLVNRESKEVSLSRFFGNPPNLPAPDYTLNIEEENLDLPDAFHGKNKVVTEIIISEITRYQLWPIYYLFPWRKVSDMTIQWDQWIFNDAMLDREPEESVPRLLNTTRAQGKTSLVRYGIGFLLEHGFFLTRMGHLNYAMNIKQIANATVETASYGALFAAYNHRQYVDPNDKWRSIASRSRNDLDTQFEEELAMFAIFQKTDSGPRKVVSYLEQKLTDRNRKPGNVIVFPQGAKHYMEDKFADMPFAASGYKIGDTMPDLMGKATGGTLYFESRGFRQGEHLPDDDPSERLQTIGSFNILNDLSIEDVPANEFKISMFDRIVYDGDKDDWHRFIYARDIWYTGLFEDYLSDEPKLSDEGEKFFSGYDSLGNYYKAIGMLDYVVDGINSKNIDVQTEFYNLIAESADANNGTIEPEIPRFSGSGASGYRNYGSTGGHYVNYEDKYDEEDDSNTTSGHYRHHNSGGVDNYGSTSGLFDRRERHISNKVEAREEIEQFIHANVKLSTDQQELVAAYLELLARIGNQYDANTLELLRTKLHGMKANNQINKNVYEFIMAQMNPVLLKLDVDASMKSVMDNQIEPRTNLENMCATRGINRLTVRINDPMNKELNDADAESTRWFPSGDLNLESDIKVVSMIHGRVSSIPLERDSTALTLTHNKTVLFDLDAHLDAFIASAGQLKLSDSTSDRKIRRNTDRIGRLQYSVALSAVVSRVRRYQDTYMTEESKEDDTGKTQLFMDLMAIANRRITVNGENMIERATEYYTLLMESNETELLACQSSLKGTIIAAATLLDACYQNNSNDSSSLLSAFSDLLAMLTGSGNGHASFGGQTGGYYTPYSRITQSIWQPYVDEAKINSSDAKDLESMAINEVNAELNTEREITNPHYDSMLHFLNAFVDLYKVYFARGWITSDDSSAWKFAVKTADQLFRTNGAGAVGAKYVNLYLEILFEQASENLSRKPLNPETLLDGVEIKKRLKDKKQAQQLLVTNLGRFKSTVSVNSESLYKPINEIRDKRRKRLNALKTSDAIVDTASMNAEMKASPYLVNEMDLLAVAVANDKPLTDPLFAMYVNDGVFMGQVMIEAAILSKPTFQEALSSISNSLEGLLAEKKANRVSFNNDADKVQTLNILSALFQTNWKKTGQTLFDRLSSEKFVSVPPPPPISGSSSSASVADGKRMTVGEIRAGLFNLTVSFAGRFQKWCCRRDVYPLIGTIAWRSHQRYVMGSAFMMNGGGEAGATCFMAADFLMGDNANQKMHFGHFTIYAKTVIWNNRLIALAHNIFCKDYLGGNGTKIWDPLSLEDITDYRANILTKDVFMTAIAPNWRTESNHLDMTGSYHKSLNADAQTNMNTAYFNSAYQCEKWGWENIKNPVDRRYDASYAPKFNTLCFQGHEARYDHNTRNFDRVITNKGHWGPREYPNCGKVRKGWEKTLQPVSYDGTKTIGLVK